MQMQAEKSRSRGLVFREPETVDELIDLLHLRHEVFRSGRLSDMVAPNKYGLDVDCYDIRARHFGLYRVEEGAEIAVGYLRVVEDDYVEGQVDVHEIGRRIPEVGRLLEGEPSHPYPLMKYVPGLDTLTNRLEETRKRGERIVEACRMALIDSERSLLAARHIYEGSMAIYWFHMGYEHKWVCCDASKQAFYRRYGVRHLEGTPVSDFCGIGVESICLFGSKIEVPASRRRRLNAMAEVYARTGRIFCFREDPERFVADQLMPLKPSA